MKHVQDKAKQQGLGSTSQVLHKKAVCLLWKIGGNSKITIAEGKNQIDTFPLNTHT